MLIVSPLRMAGAALMAILLFFLCSLTGLLSGHELRDGYNDQFVPMVDPGGRDPEQDLTFSLANKNNSEANWNNAKAVKELAHATSIIGHLEYDDPLYVPKEIDQMQGDSFNRGMLFVVGLIFVFVMGFVVMGMFGGRRNNGNSSNENLSRR
jgi:hypothetical protein